MYSDNPSVSINNLFSQLNDKANSVYKFVMFYNDYMSETHDYGTGALINMVEVHTLTAIEENPGISISQLANMWNRTNSALSQTATKLENKGYILRIKDLKDARAVMLYATPEGKELSAAHRAYDSVYVTQTLHELAKFCSLEEIDSFFKVMESFTLILENDTDR